MALEIARQIPTPWSPADTKLSKEVSDSFPYKGVHSPAFSSSASSFPSSLQAAVSASSSSSLRTCTFPHCMDTSHGLSFRHRSPLPPARRCRVISSVALNPDFYHILYKQGVPIGSKLKLFNLPYNCNPDALIQHFSTCGASVRSLKIINKTTDVESASGYAVLGDLDQACAAVAQLDGARFQGKCVRMDFVERRPYQSRLGNMSRVKTRTPPFPSPNKVFIGNLPWRVDSMTLHQLFSVHGTVKGAEIMRDKANGRSLGYGFVEMSTSAEMQKAIAALDGCEVEGRSLVVSSATSR